MTYVNTDYTFQYDEAQEILSSYDFNKDGKITYDDYWKYSENKDKAAYKGIEFSGEEIKAWETLFLIENEVDNKTESITQSNAETFLNKILGTPLDPAKAKTLNELQAIGKQLTAYIRNCTQLVETFDDMIEAHGKTLKELEAEKTATEARYQEKTEEVANKQQELKDYIRQAVLAENNASQEYEERYSRTFDQCLEDYKNGELEGYSLAEVLRQRLVSVGFDTTMLRRWIDRSEGKGSEINSCCSDLDKLTAEIRNINSRYNAENTIYNAIINNRTKTIELGKKATQYYEQGYQRRLDMREEIYKKYHVSGATNQLAKLNQFLNDQMLESMPLNDAWEIVKKTFNETGIVLKSDGTMEVPKGNGTTKNTYDTFVEKMQTLFDIQSTRTGDDEFSSGTDVSGSGSTTRTNTNVTAAKKDPIGFVDGDTSYNFVIDRDGDGIFDGDSEFLGSKQGWSEMEAYDLDGNGVIEGDELAGMTLLAVDNNTGKFTFKNAFEAGVESIDLNSYKKTNKRQVNDNILAGTFNITIDGKELLGKQTYDSLKNLNNNFGIIYGSEMTDLTSTYEENPFMEEFVEQVNTKQVAASAQQDITSAESSTEREVDNTVAQTTAKYSSEALIDGMMIDDERAAEKRRQDNEAAEERKAEINIEEAKKEEQKKLLIREEE